MNTAQTAVGEVVGGRYRIEARLGQGGMAVVYRATHIGTGKACALKLVHPHLVTRPELVELFVREAQITGRIGDNPHIVDVFDAGADVLDFGIARSWSKRRSAPPRRSGRPRTPPPSRWGRRCGGSPSSRG